MKLAVIATIAATIVLAGCRREEATPVYEPLKLGGPASNVSGTAR